MGDTFPPSRSDGRANLHQGAVAAAIDLSTGRTFGGVCDNRAITHHPDTTQPIAGIQIPLWRDLLDAAMRTSDALGMEYVGVDFMIDEKVGPVVLEANAREAERTGARRRSRSNISQVENDFPCIWLRFSLKKVLQTL